MPASTTDSSTPPTHRVYNIHLRAFTAFVGFDYPAGAVDLTDAEAWRNDLAPRLAASSQNCYVSTLRGFCRWAVRWAAQGLAGWQSSRHYLPDTA